MIFKIKLSWLSFCNAAIEQTLIKKLFMKQSAILTTLCLSALLSLPVSATTITDAGGCSVNDVTGTANPNTPDGDSSTIDGTASDLCIGVITGENDSENLINNSNITGNADGWTDFFGFTDWQAGAKWETIAEYGYLEFDYFNLGLQLLPGGDVAPGDWIINAASLSLFDDFMFVIKQSNGFAAYYFDATDITGGSYQSNAFIGHEDGISHATIYVRNDSTTNVPEPAPIFILALGLGVLMLKRRS